MYILAVKGPSLKIFALSPSPSQSLVARAANRFCNRFNVCLKGATKKQVQNKLFHLSSKILFYETCLQIFYCLPNLPPVNDREIVMYSELWHKPSLNIKIVETNDLIRKFCLTQGWNYICICLVMVCISYFCNCFLVI